MAKGHHTEKRPNTYHLTVLLLVRRHPQKIRDEVVIKVLGKTTRCLCRWQVGVSIWRRHDVRSKRAQHSHRQRSLTEDETGNSSSLLVPVLSSQPVAPPASIPLSISPDLHFFYIESTAKKPIGRFLDSHLHRGSHVLRTSLIARRISAWLPSRKAASQQPWSPSQDRRGYC